MPDFEPQCLLKPLCENSVDLKKILEICTALVSVRLMSACHRNIMAQGSAILVLSSHRYGRLGRRLGCPRGRFYFRLSCRKLRAGGRFAVCQSGRRLSGSHFHHCQWQTARHMAVGCPARWADGSSSVSATTATLADDPTSSHGGSCHLADTSPSVIGTPATRAAAQTAGISGAARLPGG